ncbi:MAG: UDP-glucose 4-epimerase GalE, partial [Campylobacterales bacterium]|nr:UDP-glucose 4-epimerase GalE [Campylobacterales bacterium]
MNVLITGGTGYIGSHTSLILLEQGYELTVYDNLSNSSLESIKRVEKLTDKKVKFIEGDILDKTKLDEVFSQNSFDSVIHFAGLKSVGESVDMPLHYYQNNVTGTLNLLEVMQKYEVYNLVFSSSATVYGYPEKLPITEDADRNTTNPYGTSKLMIEYILEDLVRSNSLWKVVSLRYFNPVGAHSSGMIGEDPNGMPNNLMPYISQVAIGLRDKLNVFGGDYDTKDGTGVRDYIHVVDLAKGHLAALEYLQTTEESGFLPVNLGTGKGYSVLD